MVLSKSTNEAMASANAASPAARFGKKQGQGQACPQQGTHAQAAVKKAMAVLAEDIADPIFQYPQANEIEASPKKY